jgi:hypothetical protein
MGTSKANPGATAPVWRSSRRRAGRWARAGGGDAGGGIGGVVGAAAAALASSGPLFGSSAQAGAQRLGEVLSGIGADGLEPTLERLGLNQLVGKSGLELLAGLLEYIGGDGSDFDDAALQTAVRELLDQMAADGLLDGDDLVIDAESAGDLFLRFFANYLTLRILFSIADIFETATPGEEAARREAEIREYVEARLRAQLATTSVFDVDWSGAEGQAVLDDLARQVLEIFGPDEETPT